MHEPFDKFSISTSIGKWFQIFFPILSWISKNISFKISTKFIY